MKKKLFSLIFISIMALVPFKVNAETYETNDGKICQVHKDYFLSFEYYSSWSFSESDPLEINKTSLAQTRHVDNYVNSRILSSESIKVTKTGIGDTLFNLKEFNDKVFEILDKNDGGVIRNNYVELLENDSTKVRYFIHSRYSDDGDDTQTSYPFFYKQNIGTETSPNWYSYANLADTLKKQLKDEMYENGYRTNVTFDMELVNPDYGKNVQYNIEKDYTASSSEFNEDSFSMTKYFIGGTDNNGAGFTGGDVYYRIIPGVFMIKYYNPSECTVEEETTTYTVTYHKNDGSNDSHKVTADPKYTILDPAKINGFTREGYSFVGWSTNKDATQADSSYQIGKEITLSKNLELYAVWLNNAGGKEEEDQSKNGLGYSIGLIGSILAATGGGVVYFKKRNKFENI